MYKQSYLLRKTFTDVHSQDGHALKFIRSDILK